MKERENCRICEKVKFFAICPGCDIPICAECSRFELIGSGCGCVWPVYYCITCARDPMINPNAVFRDPDT